jgi:hypothetical protein
MLGSCSRHQASGRGLRADRGDRGIGVIGRSDRPFGDLCDRGYFTTQLGRRSAAALGIKRAVEVYVLIGAIGGSGDRPI